MYTNATTAEDMKRIRSHVRGFLDGPQALPVSYAIGSKKYRGIPAAFSPECERQFVDSNIIEHIFTGKDPETSLCVKAECVEYLDYPVVEWTLWLENAGTEDTPVICDFYGMDGFLPGEKPELIHNTGDTCEQSLYTDIHEDLMEKKYFSEYPEGGRSNDSALPYYRVLCENFGYTLSIGWPGQWLSEFCLEEGGFVFRAKQKDTCFYLKPGEKVRSPRMTIMTFEGGLERGINLWRRWLLAHVVPKPNGRVIQPFYSLSDQGSGKEAVWKEWGDASAAQQLSFLDSLEANDLIPDNLWIDAGWYPCKGENGNYWIYTGALHADPERFPEGLKVVSDRCHKLGMSMLLWFETERISLRDTGREYPERFILRLKDESVIDTIRTVGFDRSLMDGMGLFNFGDRECCDWMIEHIDGLIKEYGIDIYRQDFNFPPLHWWKQNDEENRIGITENFYNQGYLRFWKELLLRNPGLWINSVASGGRRSDLETLRISAPLHQTDYGHGNHPLHQAVEVFSYTWQPFHGSFAMSSDNEEGDYNYVAPYIAPEEKQRFDNFMAHNAFSPHYWSRILGMNCALLPDGEYKKTEEYAYYVRFHEIWKKAVPYTLNSDFYVLSMTERTNTSWYAVQFHQEEKDEGILHLIRNTKSQEETYTAHLRQIDEKKKYLFESPEFERSAVLTGAELLKKGFEVALPKRTGELWFYRAME